MPMPPGIAKFFSSLPAPPFFSAKEDTLKYHLLKAAEAAAELLPPGGEVPLQMWLDCRMPGEVILCNDNDGLIVLLPKTSQSVKLKAEVGTTPHKASPPTSAASLWMSPAPPPKAPPGAPPPSPEANLAYKKKGEESSGVIRVIKTIVAGVEKEIQTMVLEEKDAHEDCVKFMADAKAKRSQDSMSMQDKEGVHAGGLKNKQIDLMETEMWVAGEKCDDGAGWRRQPPAGVAPAAPLRVNLWDDVGLPYNFQEFVAYYGSAATQMWDLAVRPEVTHQ